MKKRPYNPKLFVSLLTCFFSVLVTGCGYRTTGYLAKQRKTADDIWSVRIYYHPYSNTCVYIKVKDLEAFYDYANVPVKKEKYYPVNFTHVDAFFVIDFENVRHQSLIIYLLDTNYLYFIHEKYGSNGSVTTRRSYTSIEPVYGMFAGQDTCYDATCW